MGHYLSEMPEEYQAMIRQEARETRMAKTLTKDRMLRALLDATEERDRLKAALQGVGFPTPTPRFLRWIAARLVNIYGENEHTDFVLSLRERADMIEALLSEIDEGKAPAEGGANAKGLDDRSR